MRMNEEKTSPKKKMAIFSATYLPSTGGVEQFTANLAQTLARRGHGVIIVTEELGGSPAHEVEAMGVEVFRLPSHALLGGRLPLPRHDGAFEAMWNELLAVDVDSVLINTRFYPHTLLGLEYAREKGVRAVVLDHGSGHIGFGTPGLDAIVEGYEHAITEKVKAKEPAFYGVSGDSALWLAHFGIRSEGVIHNAIDAGAFRSSRSGRDFRRELGIPEDRLLVAYVGRLVGGKGADKVVDVANVLSSRENAPFFVVAGDGPKRAEFEKDVSENLAFVGRISHGDVSELFQESDVLLYPSEYPEGLPTVVLEAGACGATVVSADVGGVRDIIPDDTYGIVTSDLEPQVLSEYVSYYCEHPEVARYQATRCRERVERLFTWDATADAIEEAFNRASISSGGAIIQ